MDSAAHGSDDLPVGVWAKKYYFASRAIMDTVMRRHDLGSTQWYVLHQLATTGPTMQRDLVRQLQIERATLSVIVTALVRKGLVEQEPDVTDQRQRLLTITAAGRKLWNELPDPIDLIQSVAFEGADRTELATALRVLRDATRRLEDHQRGM